MGERLDQVSALRLWHGALADSVRRDGPDLSARQMAILLTVYLDPGPCTVRGLAADLSISKPAVTRALDRLVQLGYDCRVRDDADRRSVLLRRTVKGSVFLSDFADLVGASHNTVNG
jgi:DNA-binding MarR family transcriptional regulator